MELVDEYPRQLVVMSGAASISGGLLWIAAVTYLQFGTAGVIWYPGVSFLHDLLSVFAPLLLLTGLFGVYVLDRDNSFWLGKIGLLGSFLGIALITWQNFYYFWLGGRFGGVLNQIDPGPYIGYWFESTSLGMLVSCFGITLLRIANRKARSLGKSMTFLAIDACLIWLVSTTITIPRLYDFVKEDNLETTLARFGGFAGLLALFGVGWIWMGIGLMRSSVEPARQFTIREG
jgi:hypothetical protein